MLPWSAGGGVVVVGAVVVVVVVVVVVGGSVGGFSVTLHVWMASRSFMESRAL